MCYLFFKSLNLTAQQYNMKINIFCIISIFNGYANEPPQKKWENVCFGLLLSYFISKTLQDTRMWVLVLQHGTFTPNITKIKIVGI